MYRIISPLIIGVFFLSLWEIFVWYQININGDLLFQYILPSPSQIFQSLWSDRILLLTSLFMTLKVTFYALIFSIIVGVGLAILFSQSRTIEMNFSPYVIILQVTPLVAIAPLILIWINKLDDNGFILEFFSLLGLSKTQLSLVSCAWIVALFPIFSNSLAGFKSTNEDLENLFKIYKSSRWQVLWHLKFKSALPYFLTGLKISGGLALIGAIVAEFVLGTAGFESGLASRILEASYNLRIDQMFASLVLISLSGICVYFITHFISYLLLRNWHESFLNYK